MMRTKDFNRKKSFSAKKPRKKRENSDAHPGYQMEHHKSTGDNRIRLTEVKVVNESDVKPMKSIVK